MASAKAKLEKSLGGDAFPLDYSTSLRVIRDALAAVSPAPVVVSEGANTMDNARFLLTPPPISPSAIGFATLALFLDNARSLSPCSAPVCPSLVAIASAALPLFFGQVRYLSPCSAPPSLPCLLLPLPC